MDHEHLSCAEPELGMYASDRDLFDRVWKRVMPEERADCPIVVPPRSAEAPTVHTPVPEAPPTQEAPPEPPPLLESPPIVDLPSPEVLPESEIPADPENPVEPEMPPESEMPVEPENPVEPEVPTEPEMPPMPQPPTGDDFPSGDAVPCLGSASAAHGEQLQEDILSALEAWQLYRHLARRVTGAAARSLSALASEKHRQARRLAAAYFLISGVRYWPTDRLAVPRMSSWLGTLRRRFAAEQQLDSRFRTAALDTEDACLADLYGELADGCAAHAGVLRALLESAL